MNKALTILPVLLTALTAAAGTGYSVRLPLEPDGTVAIVNEQRNSVWRPVVVTIVFPSKQMRSIEITRIAGGLEYPVTAITESAYTYAFEFHGNYWFSYSHALRINTTAPAEGAWVEVIRE